MAQTRLKKPVQKNTATKAARAPFKKMAAKKAAPAAIAYSKYYADLIIRVVRANFSDTTFTRDDILGLLSMMRPDSTVEWSRGGYGIHDVTTGTRYRRVCEAVSYLTKSRQLKEVDHTRFCLPDMFQILAAEIPPHLAYTNTVRRLIQENFTAKTQIDGMMVVRVWQTDQHLPENVKRGAVRLIFTILVREKLLLRGEYNTYVVR